MAAAAASIALVVAACSAQPAATADPTRSARASVPSAPVAPSASPTEDPSVGGRIAFVRTAEDGSGETIVRDLATGAETALATMGSPIAFSQDGSTLYVVEAIDPYRARLLAYPTTGGAPTELSEVMPIYGTALTSPNGRYLLFDAAEGETSGLLLLDLAAGTTSLLTTDAGTGGAWSPDSQWIAYTAAGDLFVVAASGGDARRLTNDEFSDHPIGWTEDGSRIVEISDRDTDRTKFSSRTWLVSPTTGAATLSPGLEDEYGHVSRSPDGRWDVVMRNERLEIRPVGGSSLDRSVITREPGGDLLSWDHRGAWLVYPVRVDGQVDLFMVRVPDGEPIRLTWTDADESVPVWGRPVTAGY